MVIAEAATSPWRDDDLLAIFGDFDLDFSSLRVFDDRSQWHVQKLIRTVRSMLEVAGSGLSWFGNDVLPVLEVQQRPEVPVAPHNHMPTPAAIAAVRSTF